MSLELSILSGALTACIIYIIHMNRQDQRSMEQRLRESIHGLRTEVQGLISKVAFIDGRQSNHKVPE